MCQQNSSWWLLPCLSLSGESKLLLFHRYFIFVFSWFYVIYSNQSQDLGFVKILQGYHLLITPLPWSVFVNTLNLRKAGHIFIHSPSKSDLSHFWEEPFCWKQMRHFENFRNSPPPPKFTKPFCFVPFCSIHYKSFFLSYFPKCCLWVLPPKSECDHSSPFFSSWCSQGATEHRAWGLTFGGFSWGLGIPP